MKAYHLMCDYDFKGANLCSNSGVYLSRERAVEVFNSGFAFQDYEFSVREGYSRFSDLEAEGLAQIEEIEID